MKLNKQIFGWLGASALLLTACTTNDNLGTDPQDGQIVSAQVYGNGSNIMTLTIDAEGVLGTKGDLPHISDGSKADVLKFAVYEKVSGDNGVTYVLAPQFKKADNTFGNVSSGDGQNVIKVNSYPVSISLATDPAKDYLLAFWAQNSETNAFNTDDLANVKVNYNGAKNNDELRDAFCQHAEIAGSTSESHIVMHRPFAQVNVATTGADYQNIMFGPYVIPNKAIKYSKIVIKGVSDQLNVLTDAISKSDALNDKEVVFEWNKIPAFINYSTFPANLVADGIIVLPGRPLNVTPNADEEFLYVDLNQDKKFEPYKVNYPTLNDKNEYLTEVFKYMSMCYVLADSQPKTGDNENGFNSTTLDKVTIYFAENEDGSDDIRYPVTGGSTTYISNSSISIESVPVCRNWRTNILGGIYWMKDPTYPDPKDPDDPTPTPPDGPDDPTSLINTIKVCVHLCPIFDNENNGIYNGGTNNAQTKWLEATEDFPKGDDTWHDQFENEDLESSNGAWADSDAPGDNAAVGGDKNQDPETPELGSEDNEGPGKLPGDTPKEDKEDKPEVPGWGGFNPL